jgi:SAM-dependent methyltransferase
VLPFAALSAPRSIDWKYWMNEVERGDVAGHSQVRRLAAEPWLIDAITVSEQRATVQGWALPDPDAPAGQAASSRFLVNEVAPIAVQYPIPRPDVQQVLWRRANATESGYELVANAVFPNGVMKLTCRDTAAKGPEQARQNWYVPDPALHTDLPDPDRRFRVIANRDPQGFLLWGATDAFRIRDAYEAVTDKKWADLGAVLDWGVGCGRVARHLAPALGNRFFGCDIDADNVRLCRDHLPGNYAESKLQPRLPYESNSFDAIYGVSVFTHLRAQWEQAWLEELHRVLRPGGTMLVTVHGRTTVDFASLKPDDYQRLVDRIEDEGLVVTSSNNQLDGFVEHPEEYVNVFHSERRIQENWGRWFKDIRQLRGLIFTHDLVVATKP